MGRQREPGARGAASSVLPRLLNAALAVLIPIGVLGALGAVGDHRGATLLAATLALGALVLLASRAPVVPIDRTATIGRRADSHRAPGRPVPAG